MARKTSSKSGKKLKTAKKLEKKQTLTLNKKFEF
jgi:hypothetical protein